MHRWLIHVFCFLCCFIHPFIHAQVIDTTVYKKYTSNIFNEAGAQYTYSIKKNVTTEKTIWFYVFSILALALALLQLAFPKYFKDLYKLAFHSSFKQRQLREQLLQNPQPSLLLNIFYILNASIYTTVLLRYFEFKFLYSTWVSIIICAIFFTIIYTGKHFILYIIGWLFNIKEATTAYSFVFFSIQKIIGLLLLPLSVLFVFANKDMQQFVMAWSIALIGLLCLYRYITFYNIVRANVAVSSLHFFIYLCSLEVVPLLIVIKALTFFIKNHTLIFTKL